MTSSSTNVSVPTEQELERLFYDKYGESEDLGWGPATRKRFEYYNPDDWYEAIVESLVVSETNWLDVGSGRDLFPSNRRLAKKLSERARLLVGVDPDPTIHENPYLHEKVHSPIEDFSHNQKFDLITLRMVAEHIDDPQSTIEAISRVANPGARVVVYTVNKYSPVPLMTRMVPFSVRHVIKRFLWGTDEKDTFPTRFKLNSRKDIDRHFRIFGMQELLFLYLDDCRTLARWKATLYLELSIRWMLRTIGVGYPENCLLAVHENPSESG